MMNSTYTRGERMLFHCVDAGINFTSSIFLGLAYLVVAFALFAAATSLYAWYGFHDSTVMQQFYRFGGMLLFYLAAPLMAVTCIVIFVQQGWRSLWQAHNVFDEKRLHPAFVFLLGIACCMLTYTANSSVDGQWTNLPKRVAQLLQIKPEKATRLFPTGRPALAPQSAESFGGTQAGPRVDGNQSQD